MAFLPDLSFGIECVLPDGYFVLRQSTYSAEVWVKNPHRHRIALVTIWYDLSYDTAMLCVVCGDAHMEWAFRTVPPIGEAVAWLLTVNRIR